MDAQADWKHRYNLTATGDIPSERSEFCTAVTSVADDSSFQITVYGGWDQFTEQENDDVYVLTVPSFRWIKIHSRNNTDTAQDSTTGRTRHMCNLWGDSQIIITGGVVGGGRPVNTGYNAGCNSSYTPFRALDKSTYEWQNVIVPVKNYTVPSAIYNVIGGRLVTRLMSSNVKKTWTNMDSDSSTGGATASSPSGGWPNDNLKTIFSKRVPRDIFTASASTNPSPTSSTSIASSTSGTSNRQPESAAHTIGRGQIAGIVIGCVVAVALVLISLFWFLRRKKQGKPATIAITETFGKPELSGAGKENFELPGAGKETSELSGGGMKRATVHEMEGMRPTRELEAKQRHLELG